MNIDIKNRTELIETRNVYRVNLSINKKYCSLRKEEVNGGYDLYVLFPEIGVWIDIYDVKDNAIRDILEVIGYNINNSLFETESNNIDISTLTKPNKLK